jgi:hypothetical protein
MVRASWKCLGGDNPREADQEMESDLEAFDDRGNEPGVERFGLGRFVEKPRSRFAGA